MTQSRILSLGSSNIKYLHIVRQLHAIMSIGEVHVLLGEQEAVFGEGCKRVVASTSLVESAGFTRNFFKKS